MKKKLQMTKLQMTKEEFQQWLQPRTKLSSVNSYNGTACLEWQKGLNMWGYAKGWIEGKEYGVHRLVLYFENGKQPQDVHHLCHNPSCVNKLHLEDLSHSEHCKKRIRKKFCKRGHACTDENTYFRPNGRKECKVCFALRNKNRYLYS